MFSWAGEQFKKANGLFVPNTMGDGPNEGPVDAVYNSFSELLCGDLQEQWDANAELEDKHALIPNYVHVEWDGRPFSMALHLACHRWADQVDAPREREARKRERMN